MQKLPSATQHPLPVPRGRSRHPGAPGRAGHGLPTPSDARLLPEAGCPWPGAGRGNPLAQGPAGPSFPRRGGMGGLAVHPSGHPGRVQVLSRAGNEHPGAARVGRAPWRSQAWWDWKHLGCFLSQASDFRDTQDISRTNLVSEPASEDPSFNDHTTEPEES